MLKINALLIAEKLNFGRVVKGKGVLELEQVV